MQKWEYLTIMRTRTVKGFGLSDWDIAIEQQLPAIGQDGWELVVVSTHSSEVSTLAGVTTGEVWVFKRPLAS